MSRILITGSSDGLGMMAARLLIAQGHQVVLHARNRKRAIDATTASPGAETVVVADLATMSATRKLAEDLNRLGSFDAVIHNAALGYREENRNISSEGLPAVFAVNSIAPYILTSLMHRPKRLIYLSSGLHKQGDETLKDLEWKQKPWSGINAYSDSKLHDLILAFAVAKRWKNVYSNALEPGWVATKMGGKGAPDSLEKGPQTQVWLAVSEDANAKVSGKYFYHQRPAAYHKAASDELVQDELIKAFEKISGVKFPE